MWVQRSWGGAKCGYKGHGEELNVGTKVLNVRYKGHGEGLRGGAKGEGVK